MKIEGCQNYNPDRISNRADGVVWRGWGNANFTFLESRIFVIFFIVLVVL